MIGNTKVKIARDLIPVKHRTKAGIIRPGTKLVATSLTIHNTGNPQSSALGEKRWLVNPSNDRQASWHFVIDEMGVIQAIPETEVAYHSGTTEGNHSSIGIEVCESGDQEKVYANAVGFVALQLYQRGWGVDKVTTHKRWSGKECPRLLLPKWSKFIDDVEDTLEFLSKPITTPNPQYAILLHERLDEPEEWLKAIEYIANNPLPGHPVTKYIKDFIVKIGGK